VSLSLLSLVWPYSRLPWCLSLLGETLTCHEHYKIALFCGLSPPLDKSRTVVTVCDSALEIFHHYLEGRDNTTEIWTDHGNLVYFFMKQKLTRQQARWSLYLSCFRFIIIHKPGTQNKSDALSRQPDHKDGMALDNNNHVLLDNKFFIICTTQTTTVNISGDNTIRQRIVATQEYDNELSLLKNTTKKSPKH
jgi:hypothetical protein